VSTVLRLLSASNDVARALRAAAQWSNDFELCTPAVDSRLGRWELWRDLLAPAGKLRRAFVGVDGLRSEPHALEELHRLGALRLVPAADGSFRPHIFRFHRGSQVRVIAGGGALTTDGLMAPVDAVTLWEGPELSPFALETERVFARAKSVAHVPDPDELRRYSTLYLATAPHRERLAEIGAPLIRRTACDGDVLDLELVHRGRDVRGAVRIVQEQLRDVATAATRKTVGFQGGSVSERLYWSSPLGIWSLFKRLDNRYWNCFGVQRPDASQSLQITVEVNPPLEGIDRKMGGAIAIEPTTGKKFLVHRGRIGGGQRGVGAELFWSRFRGGLRMREPDRDEPSRVVIVGEIGASCFPRDVAAFVHEVRRIKNAA